MTSPAAQILPSAIDAASAEARAIVGPKVRAAIADILGVAKFEVTDGASLTNDLGADSLDLVEIAIELEGQFGVVLDDETVERAASVKDFVDAVMTCLARRAS